MSLQKHRGAVSLFTKLLKWSAWLQSIPNKVTPPPFRLVQISSAFWQSRALYVAARMDIATIIGDAALSAEAIAARVPAQGDAVFRLLRMLAAMGIFEETAPRHFGNNRLSSFLRSDNPRNVRAMILMHNSDVMSRPWYERLEQGVREGAVPFALAHGEQLFDYMDHHPQFDALFTQAMDSVEALLGDSYATDFDWGQFERLIDVGGSRGSKSVTILKRHPRLTALVVDREQVIQGAEDYWRAREERTVTARLRFQPGDALSSVPSAKTDKDIYFLSALLHGFDDETAVEVLRNVATAAGGTGARIALMELVVAEVAADQVSASFDMQMFMGTTGRERTKGEWQRLFERSGLRLEEVVALRSYVKIMVLRTLGQD